MTKTKKITALLVVVAMLFTFVAAIAACQTTDTYALSYDLGAHAATGAKAPATKEYEEGQTVKLAAAPEAASGWQFDGWKDDVKTYAAGADFRMPAKAVKFTAQWKSTGSETHTCQHVCTVCHKCQSTCTESECAQKCEVTCTGNPNYNGGTTHTCNDVCTVCNKCQSSCTEPECAQKCEVTCPGNPEYDAGGTNYGTLENPISVAEALAVISDLGSGEYTSSDTDKYYHVTGVVSRVTYSTSTYSFYIVDAGNSVELYCYYIYLGSGIAAPAKNDIVTVSGRLCNYQGTTPELTTQSSDTVKATLAKNVRGTSQITKNEGEGTHITLNQTEGANGSTFTFTVTVDADYTLTSVKVGTDNATHVDGDNYSGTILGDTTVSATAIKPQAGDTVVNMDFVKTFSTYASSWGSGYNAQTVAGSAVGASGADITIAFSRVSKQTSTITDRPVMAANNSTVYVTFTVAGGQKISAASFELAKWGSKVFHTLTIEYTTDGSNWTVASDCGGFVGASTASFVGSLSTDSLPEGVTAVRIAIGTTTSSNTQIGLTSASLTVK